MATRGNRIGSSSNRGTHSRQFIHPFTRRQHESQNEGWTQEERGGAFVYNTPTSVQREHSRIFSGSQGEFLRPYAGLFQQQYNDIRSIRQDGAISISLENFYKRLALKYQQTAFKKLEEAAEDVRGIALSRVHENMRRSTNDNYANDRQQSIFEDYEAITYLQEEIATLRDNMARIIV